MVQICGKLMHPRRQLTAPTCSTRSLLRPGPWPPRVYSADDGVRWVLVVDAELAAKKGRHTSLLDNGWAIGLFLVSMSINRCHKSWSMSLKLVG